MNRQVEEALVEALDLLEQGMPVVKILSRYPEMSDELRPYLVTALDLNHLAKPSSTAAQEASKREFLQVAAAMQVKQRKSAAVWLREILVSGLAVLFIMFFAGAVMAASSSEALPGDTLYGTKLFLEQTRLNYSANPDTAAALIEELHQERLDEVTALLVLGRDEMVIFSGGVEELAQDRWLVEGVPVAITSSTIIRDEVEVGFLVQITGKTFDGLVVAEKIEVLAGRPPDPDLTDPNPLVDPTPLPTIEPLEIPERPELSLPDDGPETNPPAPTTIPGDDSLGVEDAGYEDESDPQDSQEGESNDDQNESDDSRSDSSDDEDEDDESDERDEDDDSDDDSEESDDDEEDKDEKDSGDEEDSDDEDKGKEDDSDEKDEDDESEDDPDDED